jgi:hypothetical protein
LPGSTIDRAFARHRLLVILRFRVAEGISAQQLNAVILSAATRCRVRNDGRSAKDL